MIEINPMTTAPKTGKIIRGVWLTGERHDAGMQADIYWCQKYSNVMKKWAWRNGTFCHEEPGGWMDADVAVFG